MRPDFSEMHAKLFKKTDTDGSGTISKDEFTTAIANAPKAPGASETEAPDAEQMFSEIDTDGNGEISETEHEDFLTAKDAERSFGPPPPPSTEASSFEGSSDLIQSLKDALDESEDSGTELSDDVKEQLQTLLARWLEKTKENSGQYTANGSTQGNAALNMFETSA